MVKNFVFQEDATNRSALVSHTAEDHDMTLIEWWQHGTMVSIIASGLSCPGSILSILGIFLGGNNY